MAWAKSPLRNSSGGLAKLAPHPSGHPRLEKWKEQVGIFPQDTPYDGWVLLGVVSHFSCPSEQQDKPKS